MARLEEARGDYAVGTGLTGHSHVVTNHGIGRAWTRRVSPTDLVPRDLYGIEGRFPRDRAEVPAEAVAYVAQLVDVEPEAFERYSWTSRTIEYHRAQIREAFSTRIATKADEKRWSLWLATEVCPVETRRDRLVEAVERRCRIEKVEPPAVGQIDRVVASAVRGHEEVFAAETVARMGPDVCERVAGFVRSGR